jgi:threonine/homoserine/homoserine lactone efflux protein
MSVLLEGAAAGFGIAVPVGAIALLIIDTGMRCGFRQAAAAGAGAAAADLLYAVVAALGGAVVAAWLAGIGRTLALAGGALLVGLGLWGLRSALRPTREQNSSAPGSSAAAWPTFLRFLGLTLVNPMTVVYFAALIAGTAASSRWSAVDFALFVAGAGAASLCWQTLLAAFGHCARHVLSTRARVALSVLGNLVVCALGLRLALRVLG